VTVFVPIQTVAFIRRDMPVVRMTMFVITFALIAGVFVFRRRAMALVKATLGASDADASRLLNTAAWRTSVWRRTPTAALLAGAAAPAAATSAATPVAAVEAAPASRP
jgi:hypothetical protein